MLEYRLFDHGEDKVEDLYGLYAATYGDAQAYIKRWAWEYDENPNKDLFKIFIALNKNEIVGATTRWPIKGSSLFQVGNLKSSLPVMR